MSKSNEISAILISSVAIIGVVISMSTSSIGWIAGCESKGKLNQKMKMSSKILDIDWKIKTDNDQICVIYSLFQILLDRPDFPWSLRFKIDFLVMDRFIQIAIILLGLGVFATALSNILLRKSALGFAIQSSKTKKITPHMLFKSGLIFSVFGSFCFGAAMLCLTITLTNSMSVGSPALVQQLENLFPNEENEVVFAEESDLYYDSEELELPNKDVEELEINSAQNYVQPFVFFSLINLHFSFSFYVAWCSFVLSLCSCWVLLSKFIVTSRTGVEMV